MSEKERKAIEILKKGVAIGDFVTIDWVETEMATKTVLNLIETQSKMIELMAEQFEIMKDKEEEIDCFIPREYSDIDDCVKKDSCQECIIEYFRNKAKESE